MKVLLLAAGLGTRLRPLTDFTPKCLVPIKGQALLGIWLDRLTAAGFGPFLINTHYLSEQVHEFIAASGHAAHVTLVSEPILRGTAGTLIDNLDFFEGQDGLVIHADNYCLADFHAFLKAHQTRPSHCEITMMTFRSEAPQTCGIVELDEQGVVVKFHEKVPHPPGNLANGAVYFLSAKLLARMKSDFSSATDFSIDVLQNLMFNMYTYETKEFFLDIGTPAALRKANLSGYP